MHKIHKKSVLLFFTKNTLWFLLILGFVIPKDYDEYSFITSTSWFEQLLPWIPLVFVLILAGIYGWSYLTYRFYGFSIGDDEFKKEYGVIAKRYVAIPYTRIQNINIRRGILDRIMGLSTLKIETAGSSNPQTGSEGRIPGLTHHDAISLREELLRRTIKNYDQGL